MFKPFQKGSVDSLVSLGEFNGYFVQEWPDLVFSERQDPGDNPARSLGILVAERAQKDARLVRPEDRSRAFDVNRGRNHGLAIPRTLGGDTASLLSDAQGGSIDDRATRTDDHAFVRARGPLLSDTKCPQPRRARPAFYKFLDDLLLEVMSLIRGKLPCEVYQVDAGQSDQERSHESALLDLHRSAL